MGRSCKMNGTQKYKDGYWNSDDGLTLHYRDYPSESELLPVLCIPGLSRNARDFAHLGDWLDGKRRIIMVNLRGRGESEYAKDSTSYVVHQYIADIVKLMDELNLPAAVFIGTSLGGVITMMMAKAHPGRVAGALLNDVGPELDPVGLERIASTVGQGRSFDTWAHTARDLAATGKDIFPDFKLSDWIAHAKKLYSMNSSGRIKLDYDMKIAEPFDSKGGGSGALWRGVEALEAYPVTILRGELSDLLSAETADQMLEKLAKGHLVTVPHVGHVPTLEEPASLDAISALLQRVDG